MAGDVDGDGTVTAAELTQARTAYAARSHSAADLAMYDFDGDGGVGASDYARVQRNFGRRI